MSRFVYSRRHAQFLALLLLTAFFAFLASSAKAAPRYSQVVVFGDSLSDYGNVAIPTSSPATKPSSKITGSWVMQLASKLGLPLEISSRGGTNYARCWATSSDIVAEVNDYLKAQPQVDPHALYVLWGGGNDIFGTSDKAAADRAVETLKSQVLRLGSLGARNFLWANLPDLGKIPAAPLLGNPASLTAAATEFNNRFASVVLELAASEPRLKITPLDCAAKLRDIMANKAAYELDNVTGICIGKPTADPDRYLFWDGVHPTSRGHQIFADYALEQLQAETAW